MFNAWEIQFMLFEILWDFPPPPPNIFNLQIWNLPACVYKKFPNLHVNPLFIRVGRQNWCVIFLSTMQLWTFPSVFTCMIYAFLPQIIIECLLYARHLTKHREYGDGEMENLISWPFYSDGRERQQSMASSQIAIHVMKKNKAWCGVYERGRRGSLI